MKETVEGQIYAEHVTTYNDYMYIHPNSVGHNAFNEMPEIFTDNKVDFMHFCTALSMYKLGRANDFFDSGSFMFGSKDTKDINMLFSAVQRCYGYKYKDFQAYISSKRVRGRLLDIADSTAMGKVIQGIRDEYNAKHGMSHQIHDFYINHLSDNSKNVLLGGITVPAYYFANFANDHDTGIKQRLDFLLKFRNSYDHSAMYHQLSPTGKQYEHVRVMKGKKEYTFFVKLTFEELYEITRQAMADFWLKEYNASLADGRKTKVDDIVMKTIEENRKINEEHKKAVTIDR
jgi:hypothetical protein